MKKIRTRPSACHRPAHCARQTLFTALFSIVLALTSALAVDAQSAVFSYQGKLDQAGNPANGVFQMTFSLWSAAAGPSQVGSSIGPMPVTVANGGFTVALDFGAAAFGGAERYLEVSVGGVVLAPRTRILVAPYAIRALTVTGPVTGNSPTATLTVTNAEPGISDPSPLNLPPAALKGEATSTVASNIGLLGIGNGAEGIGVVGITNGNAITPGGSDPIGVLGLAASSTGDTVGVLAQSNSPTGTALEAEAQNGGFIFKGFSDDKSSGNPKFEITKIGQVRANGSVFAKGFHLNSTLFGVTDAGNLTAAHVDSGSVTTTGNISAGGVLSAGQGMIVTGLMTTQGINVGGHLSVSGNLNVSGAKNNVIELPDGRPVYLHALESPDAWFEDFGTIVLKNGQAWVQFDPTFAQTVNLRSAYMVFLTPGGPTHGLYVSRKTADGFEVRESASSRSNISFDYRVVARRKGYEEVRFAQGSTGAKK